MEKLKLSLAFLFISFIANSQAGQINQIKIVNFTVKNQLPGTVDSWLSTPAALVLTVQKAPGSQLREPMMVLQIRNGGAVICGNTTATPKRIDPFDVRVFNTADLTAFLGNCPELKAGTYTICVQFFNSDKVAISQEVCKDFRVEDAAVEYAPPSLTTPDNGKIFTPQELQGVVMFRWTPLVPKPKEPVTYRLKVWQLMQGQNGTQAMRTNQPIVTKDVDNITQATISGIYTGPCRPPYLCDFIWEVQALNRNGKPMGNNNGTGEPYTFGVTEEKSKGPVNVFPEEKKITPLAVAEKEITFRWSQIAPRPQEPVKYRLKVWQLMQGQNSKEAMNSNSPLYTFDIDGNGQADALTDGLMVIRNFLTGPCKPPYLCDFVWNVQVVTRDGTPGATSESTTFSVTEEKSNGPANLFPEDKKKFTPEEAKKEMIFRWTPIVPKPQEPVTYRLKVWQLMQGQNGSQAMRTNQPIVTKDVDNITQATISGLYTGPCRPPYLCDYIWVVEARIKNADGISELIATSSPYAFLVVESTDDTSIIEARITLSNSFPENKREFKPDEIKQSVTFRWTPVVPKPQEPVTYRLKVWQLMQGQSGSQAMKTNKPIVIKDVADITEGTVNGIYTGPCRPPYLCDYIWEVQAVTRTGTTLGTSNPTEFNVKEAQITGPGNTFPEDKKQFTSDEAMKGLMFRWTPVVPKPQEPVTYRLKVWQLMQGQNGSQAMRTNQPIVTKDVADITEATASGIYTGPCRPPYLCDFVWNVQAMDSKGKPVGDNEGTSEEFHFSIQKPGSAKPPTNIFPGDKLQFQPEGTKGVRFRWTPVVPKPQEPVTYRLKVWQLMQGQSGSQAMRTNQPIVTKDVADITEATVPGIYTGPCRPPYLCDFIWSVEASTRQAGAAPNLIGTSEPTTFNIKTQTQTEIILPLTEYTPPKLMAPENRMKVIPNDIGEPVLFKWTAATPKPSEPVTYRLRVWQLMQGQSGSQALRTNQPIVTKDVDNLTQASVNGIYTGPCKPPYLCDFIWNVQAITYNGIAVSTSKTFLFEIVDKK